MSGNKELRLDQMNKMFSSGFIVILLVNYCLGGIAGEIQRDGSIQIGGKPLIVDPVTDLKWLHAVPASNQKPDAEQIFNQNLEMVASENEPILNGRLPSGKRRLDEIVSAEASVGHSRGSYIRDDYDNQNQNRNQESRGGRSKGNTVGFDDQMTNTNQNYNRRSTVNNHGKNQRSIINNSNNSRKTMAESRKSSSKPYLARQQDSHRDDIFDDDDTDDNRANKRSDSDDSIFRDDDDENESSQDGSSQEYRGRNLRTAAAGANPNNLRYDGISMYRGGRNNNNNNKESSSLNDDGNSEDEDIDSTNLAKQKVLPSKEAKKLKYSAKKQVKTQERVDQVTDRERRSHNRRNGKDSSGSLQSFSGSNDDSNHGSDNEQEDALSANSQHVSQSSGDLQTAAGHHHGKSHGHYYQYAGQPKKKAYKWGFKRGNHKHESK